VNEARRLAVALGLTLLLVGCTAPSSVAPGTGPASTAHSPQRRPKPPTPSEPSDRPVTGSFHQQIVYPDGVAVEVVRIKHTRLSDIGWTDTGLRAGAPIQLLTVRVTNNSTALLDVDGATGLLTYGQDGVEAGPVFDAKNHTEDMSGKLVPRRSKTGIYGYIVPTGELGSVQFEFTPAFNHEPAIFTGSIK
jgi:hypothetical protein